MVALTKEDKEREAIRAKRLAEIEASRKAKAELEAKRVESSRQLDNIKKQIFDFEDLSKQKTTRQLEKLKQLNVLDTPEGKAKGMVFARRIRALTQRIVKYMEVIGKLNEMKDAIEKTHEDIKLTAVLEPGQAYLEKNRDVANKLNDILSNTQQLMEQNQRDAEMREDIIGIKNDPENHKAYNDLVNGPQSQKASQELASDLAETQEMTDVDFEATMNQLLGL